MVIEAERDVYLDWNAFLEADVDKVALPAPTRERVLRQRQAGLDAFREFEWPKIRSELNRLHGLAVSEGLEPHWVEAGSAVYWQEQIQRQRKEVGTTPDGTIIREMQDVFEGWRPTSPLPANSAGQIAYYLQKGLRLRPPTNGVDVEVLSAAVPADALQRPDASPPARTFKCQRHGDLRAFTTWKAYIQHCTHRRESLEEVAPKAVVEMAKGYMYYCYLHNKGFNNPKIMQRHIKKELSKGGRAVHLSMEQMLMQKKEVD